MVRFCVAAVLSLTIWMPQLGRAASKPTTIAQTQHTGTTHEKNSATDRASRLDESFLLKTPARPKASFFSRLKDIFRLGGERKAATKQLKQKGATVGDIYAAIELGNRVIQKSLEEGPSQERNRSRTSLLRPRAV